MNIIYPTIRCPKNGAFLIVLIFISNFSLLNNLIMIISLSDFSSFLCKLSIDSLLSLVTKPLSKIFNSSSVLSISSKIRDASSSKFNFFSDKELSFISYLIVSAKTFFSSSKTLIFSSTVTACSYSLVISSFCDNFSSRVVSLLLYVKRNNPIGNNIIVETVKIKVSNLSADRTNKKNTQRIIIIPIILKIKFFIIESFIYFILTKQTHYYLTELYAIK